MQLIVDSESKLKHAAQEIIKYAKKQRVWIFYGEMGAGKTTLIRAITDQFQVEDNVHSPTFSLVNEYRNLHDEVFFHFDFYRIKNETEAMDIGIEEYFDSGYHCFIEWPQKIPSLLPDHYLRIDLSIVSDTGRIINLRHDGR